MCPSRRAFLYWFAIPLLITKVLVFHCAAFTDVDECKTVPSPCGGNSTCVNTRPSFKCACPSGFYYDANLKACVDVNECTSSAFPCGEPGWAGVFIKKTCVNTPGSFYCACPSGYAFDNVQKACYDINECAQLPSPCGVGNGTIPKADCRNVEGSFRCECPAGYYWNQTTKACTVTNICLSVDDTVEGLCSGRGVCVSSGYMAFKCNCYSGYTWRPLSQSHGECIDTDECAASPPVCGNATASNPAPTCTNMNPGYQCGCPQGYYYDAAAKKCVDVNECASSYGPCGADAKTTCTNNPGGYKCVTTNSSGLVNGFQDVDECSSTPSICGNATASSPAATCMNLYGTYRCVCPNNRYYYDYTAKKCMDVNECALNPYLCGVGGTCVNTVGGYNCTCPKGLVFNNSTCVDLDECKTTPSPCGTTNTTANPAATCVNTLMSFKCICPQGFYYDPAAKKCVDKDECVLQPYGCAPGSVCVNTPGGFNCSCPKGYDYSFYYNSCMDINQCNTPNFCKDPLATCIKHAGLDVCQCPTGYYYDEAKLACMDINECAVTNSPCGNGTCTNTPGSYTCACPKGFLFSAKAKDCVDDPCEAQPCAGNATCLTTSLTSYFCQCGNGRLYDAGKKACAAFTGFGSLYIWPGQQTCAQTTATCPIQDGSRCGLYGGSVNLDPSRWATWAGTYYPCNRLVSPSGKYALVLTRNGGLYVYGNTGVLKWKWEGAVNATAVTHSLVLSEDGRLNIVRITNGTDVRGNQVVARSDQFGYFKGTVNVAAPFWLAVSDSGVATLTDEVNNLVWMTTGI